ncbi:uncharacterized protein [Apostichopus japonicus]|uniref:uncharacterized protein isoform X3 n=1 Tax=Stichopus japonicus TaxID=307972 RepID=UPI003AB12DA0
MNQKMEDWISVLLFLSLPIFNSGSFMDTACITPNPLRNPSNDTTFIGVVVYNGRETFRSYRRAATTKKFDSHSYPTLGNTSCNISTVKDTNASRSCGFYSYIHIISQFEVEPLINGEEVVLGRSYNRASLQNDLRFGVFQCIASQQEHSSISTVTIMPEAAEFKPSAFTITANLDERVTLKMLASDSNSTQQVRWRYSWGSVTRELSEWEGNTTPVIEKVNTSDAGVYEAYTTSSTDSGYVRLIVRGCRYNLWGSPSCQWTCPVCYNGGICDDVSGGCVCPPGFTGGQCEQACPSGYIGRRCGISCATVIGVADCRGVEICLPHSFGCSCAPGFTGLDCQTVCDEGAYGAGCTEVCHCPSMSQCDSKTGLCSESGCERSWKGPMCQAKIFDVVGYGRPAAVQIGYPFNVEGLTTLDMDTSVKLLIGRELDTGTGKTGSGMSHENANLTTMPSTSGLPAGTLQFTANGEHNSRLTLETVSSNFSHLGVYYVVLINGKRRQHTQILRQSNNIDAVQPERFTWSVGTGESVTMTVSYNGNVSSLRWRHNGRDIPSANENTELTINYARKADEGVYECFPLNRDQSYKGFMMLNVRACPSGFWGIYCNNTCPVCYYQGICHEETGQCICQPGYHGDNCSQVCDDRSNAIGMTCDLNCTTSPELGNKCLYKQVCSPHPVGCHCRAGFGSVPKCNTECQYPSFGADCAMTAHCLTTYYNAVSGCNALSCHRHYEGPGCQQLAENQPCPGGHHGRLCNYICHCADSINCNRWTGSCYRGECAEGWDGSNCQDALPALFDAPSVTFVEGGIQVSWNHWRPGYDYGTGLVDSYRVNFGLTNILTEQQEITHQDTNNNYLTYTGLNLVGKYSISVSVIKIIHGEKTIGQSSPSVVVCLSTTPPTNVNAEPTRAEERISFTVSWEDICPSTEFTYDVYFRPATGGGGYSVQNVQYERSVTITNGLLQCTEYLVSVRRNAEGSSRNRSAETTVLTYSEVPTVMPTDVSATLLRGVNPVQILVSWTPVNVTKLNLKCDPRTTDYTYEVYYEDAGNGNETVITTTNSSTNVTISDGTLSQCTEYLISVGIKNAVGRENRTSPVTVRTDSEDPTVWIYGVTAHKTGRVDQLQVSWSTNSINQNNLKCMPYTRYTYEVHYHPTDETIAQNISTTGSQRSLTISNLQTCTEYMISVRIRNAVGRKSRATDPIIVRTKSEAPSIKPRDVRAQRGRMLGTGPQITVTWTVDAITSGNLKCDPTTTEYSFVVYYQEMSGGTQGSKVIPGRHSMDTIISEGLRQCTYYSISVSVRNAAGIEGNKSSDIYIQTDSEDPTVAISDVTAQKTGRVDQLQVSWSASSIYKYYLKCYPSTGYTFEVYYNATYETRAQNISTTGSQTSLTISDLQQCTVYSISVSIRNAVGRKGRATEPITVRTKSEAPSIIPRDVRAQRGPMLRTMPQIAVTWTVDAITSENLKCDPTTTEYSFVVYYQEASGGTQRSKLISGKHSMDTTITERLRQCTNYSISVSVRNAAEIEGSHSSNTYIQTDSEDPSTVFRFTTTRLLGVQPSPQVRVSWPGNRLSTYDLRCDPSLGYTVIISYWPKGEGGVLVKEVDNAVENVNISGLKACTYYKIAMDVRNFIGRQSNNQLAKEVLTDSEDPTTRIEFNVSRINDTNPGKIQVTWTPVNVTKLNLKCDPRTTDYTYEVYYEDAGNGNETVITTTNSSTNVTISDGTLSQCTEYLISVGIKNAVGRVNRTSPVTVRTDSEDPTVAIYGVTAQKTGRVDQLQVSWSTNSINQNNLKCMPYTGYTYEVHYHPTDETRAQNISSRGSQRSLTISNLQTCTEYSISVSIRNAVGRKSRATYPTVVRTKSEAPSIIPRDIRAQRGPLVGTRPIIAVTWAVDAITSENLKCDPTTTEYSFIVYYQGGGTQRSKEIPGRHSMGTTITERLSQCTNYSISVSVRNAAGIEGNNSSNTYLQTDSEDPSTVFRFTTTRLLGVQPSPQVRVSWPGNRLSTYDLRCDPSLGYTVIISYWPKGEGGVLVKEVDNAVENVNISGLKACTYYKIAMDVRNFIGHESNNQQLAKEVLTDSEDPTTRIEFNVSRINDTNSGQIQVTWTTDAVSFQNLKCDPSLGYDVILRYGESTGNLQKEFVTAEGINRHTLSNLLMCTEYAVSVVIRNIVDRESQNNVKKHVITDSEDVKVTPTNVYTSDVSQTSIELSWQPPESLDYTSMGCHPKYPYKYEISYRSQNFSSVTTILDQSQQEYKFTDLEPGSSYIFYLRLTNYAGRSGPYAVIECNTTVTADVLPFVLGVTFPSVFLIISLLVLVVYLITSPSRSNQCWAIRRGRIQDDNGFIEEEHSEMRTFERDQQIPNVCSSRGKTIHRHELPSYVKEQHLKEGGFHDEYKELIQGKYTSCTVAEAKINERKNRFKNVLTYDHSRVVLPLINGDSSSDYINASYIHGYKKQNAFIACQSPNKASLHDFWRMIWHEKCTKIIMVALPIENGKMKCLTYWLDTDSAPQQYSNISIERTGETASINLMIRHFKLQLGSRIHEVTQYHYFGRPDMKVPQSADILWDIIDEVEKDEDENSPPIVVHCSAGCGWTGTVIALASLRKMMKQEEAIDVFNFVNNMRKQRPLMVQVVEQYQFIFESLLINSYVGKPSTPVDDFHVNLRKWKAVTSLHKQTGLQRQFNMLSFVSPFPEDSENQVGLLSENIVKNRYPVIIPRNKFRPTLVTFVEDKTATDYINASFCDGYSKKDLFISTQLPLPNTILDFWRMVIDYKVATIVTFEAHQTWLNYLPSEGAYQYGPFSVRVMELTQEDDITTRVLRISMDHSTYQNGKGLRMWITNISLSSPSLSSFVSLIEKTQAVQRQNENRRIVVQCLDGVSQCGMFMAVYNCCTGIIVDKVIDLFTMVRKLRERRPEMVGTLEQYEFCTQAISKRLSTSSVYANE